MKKIWIVVLATICTILGMKTVKTKAEVLVDTEINTSGMKFRYVIEGNAENLIWNKDNENNNDVSTLAGFVGQGQLAFVGFMATTREETFTYKQYINGSQMGSASSMSLIRRTNDGKYLYGFTSFTGLGLNGANETTITESKIPIIISKDYSINTTGNVASEVSGRFEKATANNGRMQIEYPFDITKYNGLGNFIYQDYENFGQYDPDDKIGDPLKTYVLECDYPVGTRLDVEWYVYVPKKSTWDLFQTWYNVGTMWENIERLTTPTHELEKTSEGQNVYWYPIEQGMENYFNSFDWCYYVLNMPVVEHYDVSRNEDYNADGTRKRNAFVFEWDDVMLQIFNEANLEVGFSWDEYDYEVMVAMLYYSFPRSAKVIETGEERTYNRKTSMYEWERILEETTAELPEGWYDPSINQYYIDAYKTTDENFKNQLDDNTWFIIESWKAIPTPLRDLIIVMLCAGIIAGFIKLVM